MNTISPQSAAASLAAADEVAARMRKDVIAMTVAVTAFGIGSAAAMLIIGIEGMRGSVGAIIAGTVLLIGAMIPMQVAGVKARARTTHFTRRYLATILIWGAIYVTGMIVGGFLFPGVATFWIPMALLSAVPCIWFAITSRTSR